MPTENRSRNPAMVSVPRHLVLDAITFAWNHDANGNVAALQNWLDQPAPQPHPDPIAWMVGTAFWWTKEEADRDAAAMGLPVVPLGPMGGSGNPSAWLNTATGAVTTSAVQVMDWDDDGEPVQSLYTHADPGEVERLRIERGRMDQALVACANERDELRKANTEFDAQVANDFKFIDDLRAQLAEAQALLRDLDDAWNSHDGKERFAKLMQKVESLSASAEPSALAWACQLCHLEQPTDRPCDVCGGKTEPVATKP